MSGFPWAGSERPEGQGQQGQQRAGVGVGGRAGQDAAQALGQPEGGGQRDGQDDDGPGGTARQEGAAGDDDEDDREHDRGEQAVPGQGAGGVGVGPGQPGRLPRRGVRDGAADGPGRGQQREGGQAQPDDEPGRLRDTAAHGAGGGERGGGGADGRGADGRGAEGRGAGDGVTVGGPEQDGKQAVQQDWPGGAVERAGRAGQYSPEALAKPPHGQGPGDRSGQGELDGGAPGDAEAEQQLDSRENGVQRDHVVTDKAGRPGNGAGHDGGIALGAAGQHLRETATEHGRLELQHAVE